MNKHVDVIVVGAGSMGMAAGYFLAKKGLRTVLLDSHQPPHVYGSHHGDTRIIRHAYGEGRQYVPLALRAQKLWVELEEESGKKLFHQTGMLCVGEPSSTFTDEVIASATTYGLPLDVLTAEELRYRWPGISVPDGFTGCLETTSGVLFSERCIEAYSEACTNSGATLMTNSQVEQIELNKEGVIVKTKENVYTADRAVISAGAWMGKILSSVGLNVPLSPTRKTVAWFDSDESLYDASAFPAFFFDLLHEQYYGFPSFDGCGLKIGRHDAGHKVDPDEVNRAFGVHSEDEEDVRRFLENHMPQAAGPLREGKVCLYTLTPDEHFIIDRLPDYPHVALAAGFSGHGFKFSSVVGEILSELVADGRTSHDISMFSLKRFMQG